MDFTFHDISKFQGVYNMAADTNPAIAMRMSGFYYGSKTGYLDSQAGNNYNNAIKTGKVPILYHFAGGGDPTVEANYFIQACSPLADGDIYALDYELTAAMSPPADPAGWCLTFAEQVHQLTGVWPLLYTYSSMLSEHDFTAVLQNCGLWVADYGVPPSGTVPTAGHSYIIQQYTDTPIDTNASFISLDTLKKYAHGYTPTTNPPITTTTPNHSPAPPVNPPATTPTPVDTTSTTGQGSATSTSVATPGGSVDTVVVNPGDTIKPPITSIPTITVQLTFWQRVVNFIQRIAKALY